MVEIMIRRNFIHQGIEKLVANRVAAYDDCDAREVEWYYRDMCELLMSRFNNYQAGGEELEALMNAIADLIEHAMPEDLEQDFFEKRCIRVYNVLHGETGENIINAIGSGADIEMTPVQFNEYRRMKVPANLLCAGNIDSFYGGDRDGQDYLHAYAGTLVNCLSEYHESKTSFLGYNFDKTAEVPTALWYKVWFFSDVFGSAAFTSELFEELEEYTDGRRVTEIHN